MVLGLGGCNLHDMGKGVGRFKGRNDTLQFAAQLKGGESLLVGGGHILHALHVMEPRMFGADAGIVEACRNGMALGDLAIVIHQQISAVAVQDTGSSSCNGSCVFLGAKAEACRFHEKCSSVEAQERSLQLLASMGISTEDARKKPRQLSGGQRQRASVARALSAKPSILVADEPTSAIDQSAQAQLLNLFNGLLGRGLSIVLISHDLAVIRYLAKRVYVMCDGAFVESGDTLEIFDHPEHAYTQALIASIPGRKPFSTNSETHNQTRRDASWSTTRR